MRVSLRLLALIYILGVMLSLHALTTRQSGGRQSDLSSVPGL